MFSTIYLTTIVRIRKITSQINKTLVVLSYLRIVLLVLLSAVISCYLGREGDGATCS